MNEIMIELISEYDTAFEEAFWEMANGMTPEQFEKLGSEVCGDKIREQLKNWFDAPNEIAEGQTPLAFVGALSEADTLEFLTLIFEKSSEVIEFYAPALRSKEDFLFTKLQEAFKSVDATSLEGLFFELSVLFSLYKDEKALNLFISFIMNASKEHEDLVDFVQGLFVNFGEMATDKLLRLVSIDSTYCGRIENIYSAISNSSAKCDKAFQALGRFFQNAPVKSFAAFCLGVYGDERAVPVLMRWIEYAQENPQEVSKVELGDVLAAIKQLVPKKG